MLAITYYFLQVSLCSAVMFGYYWLVLRNKRFHQYNRFYLLTIALLSWVVPLVKIQWNTQATGGRQVMRFLAVVADNNSEIEANITGKGIQWNWHLVATSIYFAVAAFLLVMMVRGLIRLYRLLQTHSCSNIGDVHLIITQVKGTPFSFFRYIFWNEEIDIRSKAGKQILQHELTHVQQKHSIDKLLIQLLLIAGWFNPFFWLLRREMEMIHEFIADKEAVSNGDTAALAQMLLTTAYPQQQFALTHPFFFSPIKRRLQMLANDKNHRFTYVRRLIVLPLLAVVVVLFAFRNKEYKNHPPISVSTVMESVVQSFAAPGNSRTGDFTTLSLANRPANLNKTYVVVIDAGHGGHDKGALAADGTTESLLTLALAKAVKQANNNSNVVIVMTRNDDSYQSVTEKAQFANAQKADLFLSIHCNNTGQEEAENNRTGEGPSKGIDLVVASEEKAQDYKANYQLANYMANSLSAVNEFRGIHSRKQGIWVLQAVNCPSVLIEAGFMSNKADLAKLRETGYQQKFAASIVDGIQQYLHAKENGTIKQNG